MRILADENIPYVRELFRALGEVRCLSGRAMKAAHVAEADVLLVRSVTNVNAELLDGAAVRFVGTATIGTDHVDTDYLAQRGIIFQSAAGSNANSVVEYVITALLVTAQRQGWNLAGKRLGIIGVGNIGGRLAKKIGALGMTAVLNDPPLQRQTGDAKFVGLEETLDADVVTCHVPLTRTGEDATYHLINEERLARLRPGAMLINSSRGPVVDNEALQATLTAGRLGACVLDVWEGEPNIDVELLKKVDLGSPHIAGYSFDGKVNGSVMLYEAVCRMMGREATVTAADLLPAPPKPEISLTAGSAADQEALAQAMTQIYDIEADDARLRGLVDTPPAQRGEYFDRLRKTYPIRRESHNTRLHLNEARPALRKSLQMLGFQVD